MAMSFRVNGRKIWNELPNSIRLIDSITEFKKNLKTYLFRKSYAMVNRRDYS